MSGNWGCAEWEKISNKQKSKNKTKKPLMIPYPDLYLQYLEGWCRIVTTVKIYEQFLEQWLLSCFQTPLKRTK